MEGQNLKGNQDKLAHMNREEDLPHEDFEFSNRGGENQEDDEFDAIIGALQDIVISPEFEEHQRQFLDKNYSVFEDVDENKTEYTGIFKDYQEQLESYIEKQLKKSIPDISMDKFLKNVNSRVQEVDPQLFDMLLTFTDFQLFKEHMLGYKKHQLSLKKKSNKFEETQQEKGGEYVPSEQDLNNLTISGQSKSIHSGKEALKKKDKIKPEENTEDKENQKSLNIEKEVDTGKAGKKGATKANPEYNQPQKENIFSEVK